MNELIERIEKSLIERQEEYLPMVKNIQENLPRIDKDIGLFSKTQSQFMDNVLTVSHLTPIRNLRQILAEVNKSLSALREAEIKNRLKENEIKRLQNEIKEIGIDVITIEQKELQVMELEYQLSESKKYMGGAIRKINNYINQYKNILAKLGVNSFNEIDFEVEEEKYHIMKAFEQALCACRARQGVIDEGNLIYFCQIGINGTVAQKEIINYFRKENELMQKGEEPTKDMELSFFEKMYEKFKGSAKKYCEFKGMSLVDESSLLK